MRLVSKAFRTNLKTVPMALKMEKDGKMLPSNLWIALDGVQQLPFLTSPCRVAGKA